MNNEPLYTLEEAEKIIRRRICARRGYHDLEQVANNTVGGAVRILIQCTDCFAFFEERSGV